MIELILRFEKLPSSTYIEWKITSNVTSKTIDTFPLEELMAVSVVADKLAELPPTVTGDNSGKFKKISKVASDAAVRRGN
jgi:hypothetical protein